MSYFSIPEALKGWLLNWLQKCKRIDLNCYEKLKRRYVNTQYAQQPYAQANTGESSETNALLGFMRLILLSKAYSLSNLDIQQIEALFFVAPKVLHQVKSEQKSKGVGDATLSDLPPAKNLYTSPRFWLIVVSCCFLAVSIILLAGLYLSNILLFAGTVKVLFCLGSFLGLLSIGLGIWCTIDGIRRIDCKHLFEAMYNSIAIRHAPQGQQDRQQNYDGVLKNLTDHVDINSTYAVTQGLIFAALAAVISGSFLGLGILSFWHFPLLGTMRMSLVIAVIVLALYCTISLLFTVKRSAARKEFEAYIIKNTYHSGDDFRTALQTLLISKNASAQHRNEITDGFDQEWSSFFASQEGVKKQFYSLKRWYFTRQISKQPFASNVFDNQETWHRQDRLRSVYSVLSDVWLRVRLHSRLVSSQIPAILKELDHLSFTAPNIFWSYFRNGGDEVPQSKQHMNGLSQKFANILQLPKFWLAMTYSSLLTISVLLFRKIFFTSTVVAGTTVLTWCLVATGLALILLGLNIWLWVDINNRCQKKINVGTVCQAIGDKISEIYSEPEGRRTLESEKERDAVFESLTEDKYIMSSFNKKQAILGLIFSTVMVVGFGLLSYCALVHVAVFNSTLAYVALGVLTPTIVLVTIGLFIGLNVFSSREDQRDLVVRDLALDSSNLIADLTRFMQQKKFSRDDINCVRQGFDLTAVDEPATSNEAERTGHKGPRLQKDLDPYAKISAID